MQRGLRHLYHIFRIVNVINSFLQPVASYFCDINIIAKRITKAIELHPTDFKKINT